MVLVGVTARIDPLVWVGGASVVAALLMLGSMLTRVIQRSLLRRFDLSIRFYLLALGCGAIGVTLGAVLGTGTVEGTNYADLRVVHLHLNLVGLVGFTILGTVPTLLPTFAHHRAVSGREALVGLWLCRGAAALMVGGVFLAQLVGVGMLLAATAAALITGGIVIRLRGRPRHETLPFLQVIAGIGWLTTWAVIDGAMLTTGTSTAPLGAWTVAAILVGVGQVLAGSLAYLVPVVVGPPVTDNLARLGRRPWIPLAAANVGGILLVAGSAGAATLAASVWLADFARRLATVRRPVTTSEM